MFFFLGVFFLLFVLCGSYAYVPSMENHILSLFFYVPIVIIIFNLLYYSRDARDTYFIRYDGRSDEYKKYVDFRFTGTLVKERTIYLKFVKISFQWALFRSL